MANDLESSIRELAESRARKIELAEWLTSGLRARPSEPSVTIIDAPQRDELETVWMSQVSDATAASPEAAPHVDDATPRSPEVEVAPAAARMLPAAPVVLEAQPLSETPDTLQPHLLSKELEEEDLAVLPSKPSLRVLSSRFGALRLGAPWRALERRPALKRSLAAAAVVLLLGALFLMPRGEAPATQIQTELAAVQPESALPPPPPSVEPEPPPAPPVASAKPQPRAPKAPPPPVVEELDGPRGPSVARYPDLPNRVLSRLARDQATVRRSEPEPEPQPEAAAASDDEKPTWLLDP